MKKAITIKKTMENNKKTIESNRNQQRNNAGWEKQRNENVLNKH